MKTPAPNRLPARAPVKRHRAVTRPLIQQGPAPITAMVTASDTTKRWSGSVCITLTTAEVPRPTARDAAVRAYRLAVAVHQVAMLLEQQSLDICLRAEGAIVIGHVVTAIPYDGQIRLELTDVTHRAAAVAAALAALSSAGIDAIEA